MIFQGPDVHFSPVMPFKLDQVSSSFSEGSKDLVLEGKIPEKGHDNHISVQLKDAYGMVALSVKANLPSMMVEIGNNYVVKIILLRLTFTKYSPTFHGHRSICAQKCLKDEGWVA